MRFTIALLLVCLSSSALARKPYRLPSGTQLVLPQGEYRGYTLAEMKILLKMDVDLEAYEAQIPKYQQQIADYRTILDAKDKIIQSKDSTIALQQKDRERLTKKWEAENKLRHICENKPAFGSWLAWGTAGVATAVATVLAVIVAVRK